MELQLDNGEYQVVFKDSNLDVSIAESAPLNVVVGENAKIQVEQAINYIKSGQAEIEEAVQEGIASFDSNATQKTNTYNQNAQDKLSAYNTNAQEKLGAYNSNATDKLGAYNDNASEKLSAYNTNDTEKTSAYNTNAQNKLDAYNLNDTSKTNAFNQNATDKTDAFNSNATAKTGDFNDNATSKTTAFNDNATSKTTAFNENASEKQALVDASAQAASQSAAEAKQWAIGDPSEPTGNSAKYWAEQSAGALSGLTTRVSTIEGKIPSAASSSNQLADKSYVDTADNGLQTQIDAIVASSDVFDIVGTYAELQAYDISTVPVNDIIKVLVDETHNGAATYYRCTESGGVKSWSYIGSEGAYYTKGETNTLLSAKQDTLVSGTNIKTINNNSILGSGNLDINGLPTQTGQSGKFLTTDGTDASWADVDALPSQTGQSGKYLTTDGSSASWATLSVNPDNKSITTNSSDELQTVGVINSRDSSTAIKTWTGTKAQYDAIVTKDPNTLYNITDDSNVTDIRALGQLVQSTIPLVDAGLHLLDGSVIAYGSYKAFVDYMAGLVSDYPDLFTTEANWQTSVTNYGVCGKFVYDSVGKTVRLPKITGFVEGTTDVTALGDLVEAGVPNITGSITPTNAEGIGNSEKIKSTGAFESVDGSSKYCQWYASITGTKILNFDASRSNTIYGNSNTVQPQAIKAFYYIVIATSVKTDIEVDIDEIATDLNGKADIDLSNMNPAQTVKNTIVSWGMPDYANATEISAFPFTATSDGIALVSIQRNEAYCSFSINNVTLGSFGGSYNCRDCVPLTLNKGDILNFSGVNSYVSKYFIPFKGVN